MKKISDKRKKELELKKEETIRQKTFFLQIWKKSNKKSEISGKWLGNEPLSTFFHHILPKENFPLARFDEDNIILLTFEEHEKVEINPFFYEEINNRREKLKEKYVRVT